MKHRQIFGGVVALLLAAAFAQPVSAQRVGGWNWGVAYSTVQAVGDTKDFTSGFSWRGATFDVKRMQSEQLAFGLSLGWHVMSDKVSGTSTFPGGAATGVASNYINAAPILATATYFLGSPGGTRPFVGVGGGTYYIENRSEFGVYALTDSNWHAGLMAEAGVRIPRGLTGSAVALSARYNWALKASDVERQYLTFSVSFSIDD